MRYLSLILIAFCIQLNFAQEATPNPLLTKDAAQQQKWVDSIYNSMTLKERVGQLFMVQVFSKDNDKANNRIVNLIKDQHIGGVIYSTGGPHRQAKLNNLLQAASKVPLLVGMDAEWGLSMRLDSTYAFPWNMTLGAITNDSLVEQTGRQIGEHCKRLGVHFNFAPVVDINTNPKNPIIGNIVCAKVRIHNNTETKNIIEKIKAHCRSELESFKVPMKVKLMDKSLHSSRFKKVRTHS